MPYTRMYYPRLKGRLVVVKLKFASNKYCIGIIQKTFDSMLVLEQSTCIQHVSGTTLIGYFQSPQTFIAPGEENATIEWARLL